MDLFRDKGLGGYLQVAFLNLLDLSYLESTHDGLIHLKVRFTHSLTLDLFRRTTTLLNRNMEFVGIWHSTL